MVEPRMVLRWVALAAGAAVVIVLAFIFITSALMWSTMVESGRAVVQALGRANQWSPK